MNRTPIIDHDTTEPPVFGPANLLEGARRQKVLDVSRRALTAALAHAGRAASTNGRRS